MPKVTDPEDPRITPAARARFWARVDRRGADECWPWTGATVGKLGYGRAFFDDMSRINAHRLSLLIDGRAFTPDAPDALHSCDNPICVNPAHLRAGNKLANAKDMVERGRALTGERAPFRAKPEACPRGEKHVRHILTAKEVREIRARYLPYIVTLTQLAEEYGVTKTAIWKAARQKSWQHVKEGGPDPVPEPESKPEPSSGPQSVWMESLLRRSNDPLSAETIQEIYRLIGCRLSYAKIASVMRIHPDTISRLVKRRLDP